MCSLPSPLGVVAQFLLWRCPHVLGGHFLIRQRRRYFRDLVPLASPGLHEPLPVISPVRQFTGWPRPAQPGGVGIEFYAGWRGHCSLCEGEGQHSCAMSRTRSAEPRALEDLSSTAAAGEVGLLLGVSSGGSLSHQQGT